MLIDTIYTYFPLISALLSMTVSQTIKLVLMLITKTPVTVSALTRSGGMPSSHSALITAIALSVGLKEGFESSYFFIATVLSLVVIYDARGIRHTVGQHAQIMNQRLLKNNEKPLNEAIGHTLPEIIIGIAIGLSVPLTMYYVVHF